MTKIVFYRSDGIYYGFREIGHVGFGDWGQDPFCAMLSSLTMYIVDDIEETYGGVAEYQIDEENVSITVRSKSALPAYEEDDRVRYAVSGLFLTYYLMLRDMLDHDDTYEFTGDSGFEVEIVDKDYE